MRKSIWKFPLSKDNTAQSVRMPEGAKIIKVGVQLEAVTIWAEVDTQAPKKARYFEVYGTGWDMDDGPRKHLDSVFDGPYVWHIYEFTGAVVDISKLSGGKQLRG